MSDDFILSEKIEYIENTRKFNFKKYLKNNFKKDKVKFYITTIIFLFLLICINFIIIRIAFF